MQCMIKFNGVWGRGLPETKATTPSLPLGVDDTIGIRVGRPPLILLIYRVNDLSEGYIGNN